MRAALGGDTNLHIASRGETCHINTKLLANQMFIGQLLEAGYDMRIYGKSLPEVTISWENAAPGRKGELTECT